MRIIYLYIFIYTFMYIYLNEIVNHFFLIILEAVWLIVRLFIESDIRTVVECTYSLFQVYLS